MFSQDSDSIFNIDLSKYDSVNLEEMDFKAQLLFLQKDYKSAAKIYLEIVDCNIDDANSYYELSRCYAMLDKPELAGNFLVLAINAGYNNYSKIKGEESFFQIKKNIVFENVLNDVLNYGNKYGETMYVNANVFIKSRVLLPDNFNPMKEYPLLIGLHGFGGLAENFSLIYEYIEIEDFIFVVPEAPYFNNDIYNRKFQYSWDFKGTNKELWRKSDPEVINYIMNVVNELNVKFKISENYLLGFSQGAAYAYAAGIKNQEKINGVIAVGGRLPDTKKYPWFISDDDLSRNNNLKVLIAHGKRDKVVSYKNALDAKKKLSKNNFEVELILFEGGHIIDKDVLNNSLNWLINAVK
ncbi:dienelactone hydrolase family protein [Candidatus Woesearchaeota archaeon]|nr:dienelactone hydrolase family protein [Candidatus Woesearchaeota archaeon]